MPSKKKVTYGPTVKERAKRLLEALLAYVNWELEDVGGISVDHRWQDETTAQPKLVIKTELRTLELLTAKDKHEGKLTTTEIRQALNQHLKDFLEILEDNRLKTQGDKELHFTLTLWSKKDKQKNLEQFEIKWESLRPEKSKQQEETLRETVAVETSKPKEETINWQEICRHNLALQKELTTNLFTNACGMTPQLDGVYVPLAIVERQKPKPQPRNQQEDKEKETEKLIPIAEERFFEDVLRQGKSDTSQGRKIAIIGEPGAGKTTRLQKIPDWILEQDLGLPIWIDLAELGEKNICEYLEKVWLSRCRGEVTRGDLEAQMSRVWLLLDGVDEMTHAQGMQQLGKDLLRSWVQDSRVVATCRVNVWEADKNAFSGFDVFRNLQFDAEQVTEYIRRWFAGIGDAATGESLEAELAESENSRLKELIQNPLRLWMLCQIWDSRQGTLPDTQAKLYASFIKYIYRWKEQFIKTYVNLCGKNEPECKRLLHEGLGELAKAAIDGKSGRFRLSYRLVSEYLGERSDETSLLSLALSLGWLNRVGIDFDEPEESVYAFYHATFQEYFAALAVEDWDYFLPRNHVDFPVVGKQYRIFEAQWKQVILLWLGLEGVNRNQKEEFIKGLVGFEEGCNNFYGYRAYFLAAAGIGEFKDCSRADEIVRQVVKWGFGYFNEDKKEWLTFLKFIEEGARQALLQTDHKRATQQLCHILEHPQCPEETRMELADSLGTINSGNPQAVAALVKIIETTDDKIICTQAAQHLKKIGKGNPQAIVDLIGLIGTIETIESEYNRTIESEYNRIHTVIRVADCLAEIGKGNPQAIAGLIGVIETTEYEFTCMLAADCLAKIGKGNPQAIAGLIRVIETTESEYTREVSNNILRKIVNQEIKSENQEDIDSLIENLQQTRDKLTYYRTGAYETPTPGLSVVYEADCWMAAYKLSKLAKDNPKAINNLMYFLHNYNYWTRKQELFFSNKIQENQNSITEFMKFFEDIADRIKSFPCQTILNINILNYENLPERINSLLQIIYDFTLNDVSIVMAAINLLHEIIIKFPTQKERIINHLLLIIGNTNNEDECLKAAFALCKIDLNNQAITKFMELIRTSQDLSGYGIITKSVGFLKEVATQKQMPKIINSLKCCLSDEVRIREFKRFDACFDIIWHCAQNLPYPNFYRAWHGLTETQTSSLVQTLNLAQLPQFLQTQLAEINLAQTFQLLCIDTSKFIDSHNPALDIYGQFLDQNCPQRPNGEPETLAQLKSYWNQLRRDSDKHLILIFYEGPTSPAAQGLSPTFQGCAYPLRRYYLSHHRLATSTPANLLAPRSRFTAICRKLAQKSSF